MPRGDAVQDVPTVQQEMDKFKGFAVINGETVDSAVMSPEEEAGRKERENADASAKAAVEAAKAAKEAPVTKAADGTDAPVVDAPPPDEDDAKTITLKEAKKLIADAAKGRVGEMTRRLRATERERDEARAQARLTTTQQPDTTPENKDGPPDPKKFAYGEVDPEYIEAKVRFQVNQELDAAKKKDRTDADAARARAAQSEKVAKVQAFMDAGAEKIADFQDLMDAAYHPQDNPQGWCCSDFMGDLLMESDNGPEIARELSRDVKLSRELYKATPAKQARWFSSQEAKFTPPVTGAKTDQGTTPPPDSGKQAPPVKVSQAPPPVKPARGSGSRPEPRADTTDFKEFERMAQGR